MSAVAVFAFLGAALADRLIPPDQILPAKVLGLSAAALLFVFGWRQVWRLWARPPESVANPTFVPEQRRP